MHLHDEVRININVGNFYWSHGLWCKTRSRRPSKITTHTLCSHLISSLDNLMMANIQGRNM